MDSNVHLSQQRCFYMYVDFKGLKDVNFSQYKKNKPLGKGEGRDW